MPLNFLESAHYKLRALTGKNPGHEIGTGFADLAEDIDKLLWERLLNLSEKGASGATTSGQLVKCTGAITVTAPAAALNAVFGVHANGHAVTVKGASAAKIYGGAAEGQTEIQLLGYQYVVKSDGTNWFIIAGQPSGYLSFGFINNLRRNRRGSSGDFTVSKTGSSATSEFKIKWSAATQWRGTAPATT